jgi:outer membrane cobalamin receptor
LLTAPLPEQPDGSVNIDALTMLMERVDIVTGGASVIYGSDAAAGVVNCADKDFTGLSLKSDYGKSKYGDGDEYQLGAAWGTSLFNDRGHFEIAARARHQNMIPMSDRPTLQMGSLSDRQWLADQPAHSDAHARG